MPAAAPTVSAMLSIFLDTQAPLLDMMASAKTEKSRFGALGQMFASLQAAEPQEQRDARLKKALEAVAEAEDRHPAEEPDDPEVHARATLTRQLAIASCCERFAVASASRG